MFRSSSRSCCLLLPVLTSRILGANEDVGCLGQPLHELGDALGVVLGLAQGAHHAAQDAADDAREQFWVEGFCCRGGRWSWTGCFVWSGTRGRLGRREDGLRLEIKTKLVNYLNPNNYGTDQNNYWIVSHDFSASSLAF